VATSLRCAPVRPEPASDELRSDRAVAWKTAPITATPSVPPIMRFIDRIPEAMPAFAFATAFMAAVDIGDITSAMPTPIRKNEGSRSPYVVDGPICVSQNIAPDTSVSPTEMGIRGPILSVSRPAIGAIVTIMRVAGRNRMPACRGE